MDEILPKKASLKSIKLGGHATLYVVESTPLFFQPDGPGHPPLLPHLRLVHRFPGLFPSIRIDRGAIRFVLSGATLMAPGLTSKGGRLPSPRDPPPPPPKVEKAPAAERGEGGDEEEGDDDDDDDDDDDTAERRIEIHADAEGRWGRELDAGEPVVVMAEGKEEACAVGILAMGTREIKDKGKGPVIEEAHYLGDGLWNLSTD
jgi:PUA domain protein